MRRDRSSFLSSPAEAAAPRIRYCPFTDLTIRGTGGLGARLGRGAAVDFDAIVGETPGGQPLTIEAALGEHAAAFTVSPLDAAPAPPEPAVAEPIDDEVS